MRCFLLPALLLSAACGGPHVRTDRQDGYDLAAVRTLALAKPAAADAAASINPIKMQRLRDQLVAALPGRGYQVVAADAAPQALVDVVADWKGGHRGGSRVRVGFGVGSFGRHGGVGIGTGTGSDDPPEFVLAVHLIDPGRNEVIWRGATSRSTYDEEGPSDASLKAMLDAILAELPMATGDAPIPAAGS